MTNNTIIVYTHSHDHRHSGNLLSLRFMKKSFYIFILIIISNLAYAQQEEFTIKGNVRCSETNEALVGVNIYTKDKTVGCTTDKNGDFEIKKTEKDSIEIFFSFRL